MSKDNLKYIFCCYIYLFLVGSNFANHISAEAEIVSYNQNGHPVNIKIKFFNGFADTFSIFSPSSSIWFLGSVEVVSGNDTNEYRIRTDIPWFEPDLFKIAPKQFAIDSIELSERTFYSVNTTTTLE